MMFTSDYGFQHINWWHDPIAGELFKHKGTLSTHLINMRLTLGINDWWDISFEPSLVKRCMDWYVEEESVHHRTECSSVDYRNEHGNLQAKGGYLGDFQIKTRYLFKNTGKGFGSRIFFESGLIVPSGNVLVADPYFLDHDPDIGEEDHRHFSVSDGVYKGVFGFEYSMKRLSYPVFWGIFSNIQYPLKENKYEFLASKNYSLTFIALSGPPNLKGKDQFKLVSIGFGLSVRHSSYSKWHGINSPNSKSTAITPSLSFVIASKDYGTFGINLNMSDVDSFNAGDASPGNNFKQKASVVGFSLSYRKTLDKVIKKLYWK